MGASYRLSMRGLPTDSRHPHMPQPENHHHHVSAFLAQCCCTAILFALRDDVFEDDKDVAWQWGKDLIDAGVKSQARGVSRVLARPARGGRELDIGQSQGALSTDGPPVWRPQQNPLLFAIHSGCSCECQYISFCHFLMWGVNLC